ncbi:MAG TPA: hypothetical protein HA272_08955 [Methanoregula sp.]|nr:hypothetical protein [Methanoregula sp.]
MWNGFLVAVLAGALALVCLAPVAGAESVDETWRSASVDFLGFDLTDAKPSYQKTTADWLNEANAAKARCEYKSAQYDEHIMEYVGQSTSDPAILARWGQRDAEQRVYLMATGFHAKDPEAGRLYTEMMVSCDAADKAYRKAYELTAEDDYEAHAEIFDEAAGVYDAVGNSEGAGEVREAADVARGHAAAETFLPLPWWAGVLGAIGGALVFRRMRG